MDSVAVAHKDYLVRGGGEALVEVLADAFDAPLYIGGSHQGVELNHDDIRDIQATRKQRWAIKRGGLLRSLAYMAVWQNEDRLTEYETIVTSGNEPLWYVPEPEQTVIAYCHSPPRAMYDLNHNTGVGAMGALLRAFKRTLFQHNVARPDVWVANSEHVKRRMERYWDLRDRDIRVVYPPIDTESLAKDHHPTEDWYLYLGRLAGHKRVDLAIDAVNGLDGARLRVAGRGPQFDALEERAGESVEMVGHVSEQRKRELYAGARALIFPAQAEDFGMVPIEAMASGTPVIGVREGFTKHQIRDGENGILCEASVNGIHDAIQRFESDGVDWSARELEAYAEQFSRERFVEEMRDVVRRATGADASLGRAPTVTADD